jgi:hypothetical protein
MVHHCQLQHSAVGYSNSGVGLKCDSLAAGVELGSGSCIARLSAGAVGSAVAALD